MESKVHTLFRTLHDKHKTCGTCHKSDMKCLRQLLECHDVSGKDTISTLLNNMPVLHNKYKQNNDIVNCLVNVCSLFGRSLEEDDALNKVYEIVKTKLIAKIQNHQPNNVLEDIVRFGTIISTL